MQQTLFHHTRPPVPPGTRPARRTDARAPRIPIRSLGRTRRVVSALGLGLAALGRPAYMALGRDALLGEDRSVEAMRQRCYALLDAAHWATEWPWCELAAAQLDEISDRHGWDLRVHVSSTVTDPWTAHAASSTTDDSLGAPN